MSPRVALLLRGAGIGVPGPAVDVDAEDAPITVTVWEVGLRVAFEPAAGGDAAACGAITDPGWTWELFYIDEDGWCRAGHGWASTDEAMATTLREHLAPALPRVPLDAWPGADG